MNMRAFTFFAIFACNSMAQKPEIIQEYLEQVKQEEKQKETLGQKINKFAIDTAPYWVPFVVAMLIDIYRAKLCDKICDQIDPNAPEFDFGIIHMRPKVAARIALEGISQFGIYALLNGSFENGSFKCNLSEANAKSSFWNTSNYVMLGYLLPGIFKDVTRIATFVPHTINTFGNAKLAQKYCFDETGFGSALKKVVKYSWHTYMYYPQVKATLSKVKQTQNR